MKLRVLSGWAAICLGQALGCGQETAPDPITNYPQAGLYTPGSRLGASDPTDRPQPSAGLGNRCKAFAMPAADGGVDASRGNLRVQYTTQPTGGEFAPKNCGAVWLESADGRYVTTLEIRAALRRPALVYFAEHACEEQPGPDVMTAATAANHDRPHMLTWSGNDFSGALAPDGPYKLFIESTETDKAPGELASFDFNKGPTALNLQPMLSADGPVAALMLNWQPSREAAHAP